MKKRSLLSLVAAVPTLLAVGTVLTLTVASASVSAPSGRHHLGLVHTQRPHTTGTWLCSYHGSSSTYSMCINDDYNGQYVSAYHLSDGQSASEDVYWEAGIDTNCPTVSNSCPYQQGLGLNDNSGDAVGEIHFSYLNNCINAWNTNDAAPTANSCWNGSNKDVLFVHSGTYTYTSVKASDNAGAYKSMCEPHNTDGDGIIMEDWHTDICQWAIP